jgi:hypothetical protein
LPEVSDAWVLAWGKWSGVESLTHCILSFVCQLTVSGVWSLYMYDISRGGDVGDGLNAVGDGIIWIRNRGNRAG